MARVLIIGPSGSGKTYASAKLREKGINAVDADLIPDLSNWYDKDDRRVEFPSDAGKEFLDNHTFLWSREVLEKFLKNRNEIYLFGLSGNVFDMFDLFDKIYFLKVAPEVLAERLQHESRENPMGKTAYQMQNALNYAKEIEETARKLGIKMIDANKTPKEIFKEMSGGEKY